MVSPSKVQYLEQKQPARENKSDRNPHVRIQKGLKPLEKRSFYLDIKSHAVSTKLEAKIKYLGGTIELFLVRTVNLVVTDRIDKVGQTGTEKYKWGCISGGSGGIPSLKSIEVPTPTPTPPTPFFSSECPLSNSTNLQGQTSHRSKSRVDAMLERALIQPQQCSVDPLDNAQSWGIPIWATDKLQAWLDKIYASFKDTNDLKHLKQTARRSCGRDLKVKHLKGPYIKFESFQRNTRPVFLELSAWPTLNFDGDSGTCPFDIKRREKLENRPVNKDVKENTSIRKSVNKEETKEMTRRPRTTANRTRRTEQLVAGHCELCRINYRDLSKHVQSDQHLNFVRNDDNFLSLDTLINAGASVEAFLKLNRTKDIGQDCNLYPNGDGALHTVVLPEEKSGTNTKDLNNFGVEQIKMVQCNGARRNLNLKLSSPHNLRTRTKHESGHLLRSKGSPWHEVDKSDKFYDKYEGFTIKKRAKGTIWIEEDGPEDKFVENDLKESKEDYIKSALKKVTGVLQSDKNDVIKHEIDDQDITSTMILEKQKDVLNQEDAKQTIHEEFDRNVKSNLMENNINGLNDNTFVERISTEVTTQKMDTKKPDNGCGRTEPIVICNGHSEKLEEKNSRTEKVKCSRMNRRGRSFRAGGRHRLSVEERLIEDNRAYYKVEVLGNKLRSSVLPGANSQNSVSKDTEDESKKEVPSSEKPVVVRFKRVRKSELSLLSDEAESFMFGESKRDESSETSDGEQSSVLPRDTESECNETMNSVQSSPLNASSPVKQEVIEEDSQDSMTSGRARKRRRTQAEALIMDNTDYYKFETPGSRLRYQAPLMGIKESMLREHTDKSVESPENRHTEVVERMYPSKPSPEVEKMQFSFEAVPRSEPWYQTYQRQDDGAEFWHYFSEGDTRKPFLLPYEIENFHETLIRNHGRHEGRRKGRGRGVGCLGRSPRKSPRCHASTLAIMSTIIRKREQQQTCNLITVEEHRSRTTTPKPDIKQDVTRSDIDEDLKEMAKTIDEMLTMKDTMELEDSFEVDHLQTIDPNFETSVPKGPPPNLLELLDNCHEIGNCLENSSCASSECGEGSTESPLKRRKKRKNRTGWPGIKMRKKLQSKQLTDCERDDATEKELVPINELVRMDGSSRLAEQTNIEGTVVNEKKDDESSTKVNASDTNCKGTETVSDKRVSHSTDDNSKPTISNEHECKETEKTFVPREVLAENEEVSENEPRNDENHQIVFRKEVMLERSFKANKRQCIGTSDICESHEQIENQEILCRKDTDSTIIPRKHSPNISRKRQHRGTSDNPDSEFERHSNVYRRSKVGSRRRMKSRKRQRRNNVSSETVFEDENCKKDYLSNGCRKQQTVRNVKRRSETMSSDIQDQELERALSERVSPTIVSSSDLEQRRSSIEFQPVVRMMKIEDQVDMDHSILSVTVASNRRLRSSSSPRSNAQPPKKRLKTGRGQFGRWLKNS